MSTNLSIGLFVVLLQASSIYSTPAPHWARVLDSNLAACFIDRTSTVAKLSLHFSCRGILCVDGRPAPKAQARRTGKCVQRLLSHPSGACIPHCTLLVSTILSSRQILMDPTLRIPASPSPSLFVLVALSLSQFSYFQWECFRSYLSWIHMEEFLLALCSTQCSSCTVVVAIPVSHFE